MPQNNAVGVIHEEMRRAGSLIMRAADTPQAAGRRRARGRPRTASPPPCRKRCSPIRWSTCERAEVAGLPPADWDSVIIATGPLTSPALAEAIWPR